MKIAAFGDAHLGYRLTSSRLDSLGANVREQDVRASFSRCVDQIIAAQPDVTVFTGDLFHSCRPTMSTLAFALREFRRLREGVTGPLIAVAGNHDGNKESEKGQVFEVLDEIEGLDVVYLDATLLEYPALDLSVYAVPDRHIRRLAEDNNSFLPPDLAVRGNGTTRLMVMHAPVGGVGQNDRSLAVVPQSAIPMGWDFTLLGDFHSQHAVRKNVWYTGSVDFTSSDNWGESRHEAGRGKGWILVDLPSGEVAFQGPTNARRLIDLPKIDGYGLSADEIMTAMHANLPADYADAVLRQVILDITRETEKLLDWPTIRQWQREALIYQVSPIRPGKAIVVGTPQYLLRSTSDPDDGLFEFGDFLTHPEHGGFPNEVAPRPVAVKNVDYDGNPFDPSDPVLLSAQALLGPHPYDQAAA